MDFSGLGGIAVAVIAVLWVFILLPGWADGAVKRNEIPKLGMLQGFDFKSRSQRTDLNPRLRKTKLVASAAALGFFIASAGLAFLGFLGNPAFFYWISLTLPFAILGTLVLIAANRQLNLAHPKVEIRSNLQRPRTVTEKTFSLAEEKPVGFIQARSWNPSPLPSPLSNRLGELSMNAPVASFEVAQAKAIEEEQTSAQSKSSSGNEIDIDEILKRRRAI